MGHDVRMTHYEIVSVDVALPEVLHRWSGGEIVSGIRKRPVALSLVMLTTLNLAGDGQADTRPTAAGGQVHGGVDQAVYAFPSEHFGRLSEIAGTEVGPGFMGENLTLSGALETDVCIGDVWRWGDARLQVTAPRGPCFKLGIRMGRQAARTAVRGEGLVGWYLRVLVEGAVPASGVVEVIDRDPAAVSVAAIHQAKQNVDRAYPELAALPALAVNASASLRSAGRDLVGGVPESDEPAL